MNRRRFLRAAGMATAGAMLAGVPVPAARAGRDLVLLVRLGAISGPAGLLTPAVAGRALRVDRERGDRLAALSCGGGKMLFVKYSLRDGSAYPPRFHWVDGPHGVRFGWYAAR